MGSLISRQSNIAQRVIAGAFDPADVAVKFSAEPYPAVLESVCNTAGYGRFSLYAATPLATVSATATPGAVRAALARIGAPALLQPATSTVGLPFVAGWIGCIPYEAGAALADVTREMPPNSGPRLVFRLYDAALVHDRTADCWHACAVDLPQSITPAAERLDWLTRLLAEAPGAARALRTDWPAEPPPPVADVSHAHYLRAIRRASEYIAAGDIYQVNLTQRFTVPALLTPIELYLRLRAANPADFAALLPWGDEGIVSASPELFLSADPDGQVLTRPIKGTRSRADSPPDETSARAALLASPKDRAELNMIIDLLRNDLGRVCTFGSVRVLADAEVETHPTVLHLVGTIGGRLQPDVSVADLLHATLPGGSITGCPKIRAMQIIRELEPFPRGAYCGALGYVGLDGAVGLSVAIRTLQYRGNRLHLHAGGAITADSDPDAEYAETLAKAEGMFRALGHTTAALDAAPAVQ